MTPAPLSRLLRESAQRTPIKRARAAPVAPRRPPRGRSPRRPADDPFAQARASHDERHQERFVAACGRRGYELLAPIGSGGMGAVWLALAPGGGTVVAIKAMLPKVADDPQFRAMFLDEGRIASRIVSPHVVRVLALEEDDGILFQVQEWVDGESLLDLHLAAARRGARIPAPVVLRALADACAGLHAAHELRGADGALLLVVHRDVSPANVLAGASGAAKLADFGIAKARARTAESTLGTAFKGRVHYVAPEHALGQPIDRRADLWSMGATLYFLLSGREPFAASNDAAALYKLTSGEPLPPLPASVPPPVAEIAYRALQRAPRDRYATAAEMRDALVAAAARLERDPRTSVARFVAEHESADVAVRRRLAEAARRPEGETAPLPARRATRHLPLALAVGALLALVAWATRPGPPPPATARAAAIAPEHRKALVRPADTLVVELPAAPRHAPFESAPAALPASLRGVEGRPESAGAPASPRPSRGPVRRHYGF